VCRTRTQTFRILLFLVSLLSGAAMRSASGQEIWFGPRSDLADFMALFHPDAPWSAAASHVSVLEISDTFSQFAPADDLIGMAADLDRRGLGLAAGVLALSSGGPGWCGYRVEGYNLAGGTLALARRLKWLGVTPKYFSLDEPLFFGHSFVGQGTQVGCQRPIAKVAKDVGENLRPFLELFPEAVYGDVEPALALPLSEVEEWLDAFERSAGRKLAFVRIDMDWKRRWKVELPVLADLLRRKGVALHVIYNGNGTDQTDESWLADAKAHFAAFESTFPQLTDAVMIQSWDPHPLRILPETDPNALTSLINSYVDWRSGRQ
jgi:hypothetical protein